MSRGQGRASPGRRTLFRHQGRALTKKESSSGKGRRTSEWRDGIRLRFGKPNRQKEQANDEVLSCPPCHLDSGLGPLMGGRQSDPTHPPGRNHPSFSHGEDLWKPLTHLFPFSLPAMHSTHTSPALTLQEEGCPLHHPGSCLPPAA